MSTGSQRVTVRVPGSTSNCGAGFDSLGIALEVYNDVGVERRDGVGAVPEGASDQRGQSMVSDSAAAFFAKSARDPFGFSYTISGEVPPARGLGSSVTVIAGVLAGLNALCGEPLSRHELVAIATDLEGHPDNASAGILGGFCSSRCDPSTGAYLGTIVAPVRPELIFVVVSPEVELLTKESRGALPTSLPYADAVRSINSATYLTAAFVSGEYSRLRGAVSDFMHEPYRLPRIPGARDAIESGIKRGAYTGWLSGSGSSVLCVCDESAAGEVGSSMREAFSRVGLRSTARPLRADNTGLTLR